MWPAIIIVVVVFFFVSLIIFFATRYKRCPSDEILVVYGKVGTGQASRCIHGGGALVLPLIQGYERLCLTPLTISIPLTNALSLQNIRIDVPSTFTVGVSVTKEIMNNAAERLLGLCQKDIEDMAREIIFGQLRLTVASLTIEQINQDRESFLESVRQNVEPELNKIGLYLINVNITDITDESEYIESIGKKAASTAVNKAKIDVAEQDKNGSIGESEAYRERDIRVSENQAEAEKGKKKAEADRRIFVQQRESEAIRGENEANAEIAKTNAELGIKQAEAWQQAEVAKRDAKVEIEKAQYRAEMERLNAEEIATKEIERQQIEIAAAAEAEKRRLEARGEADAILARYEAEAEGVRKVLRAKGDGYRELVASCGGDANKAATLLMVEKIEDVVAKQVEAIQNLKIDKITVWDSAGGGREGESGSTANFLSGMVKSLPPLHELAEMAGVELPGYLGKVTQAEEHRGTTDAAAAQEG